MERGIYSKHLRLATRTSQLDLRHQEGDLVLLRNEAREKFQPTYFGPFRVLKKLWFGTYILETTDDRVLRKPVYGSRLTRYVPKDAGKETTTILTLAW